MKSTKLNSGTLKVSTANSYSSFVYVCQGPAGHVLIALRPPNQLIKYPAKARRWEQHETAATRSSKKTERKKQIQVRPR